MPPPLWTQTPLLELPILSIRQPWAQAVLLGLKDVENRSVRTAIRGRILIHASATSSPADLHNWHALIASRGMDKEALDAQVRKGIEYGGIIGSVEIVDCTRESRSPWFTGQWAYVLKDPQPLEFYPLRGMPGFFKFSSIPD